ncbi:MAG: sugar phosphate isomerase/epimerase [Kiritimatiellales bacterium]|nr:sugar phosphate isomerase/epimerase [Kiritimatiellales bacterium]
MDDKNKVQHFTQRLAVCSWSLQPATPADLVRDLQVVGVDKTQLDLDPFREQPVVWDGASALFAQHGIAAVSGMFRTVGEDYSTLETIRLTGGVVPDATWDENWSNAQITARNAEQLGLEFVMFHAGFLPHDPADPNFDKLVDRVRQLARLFADHGITLGCETGQETGAALKAFLEHLDEPNVAVNFDPANMLLYNNGDPIAALRSVGSWVKSVHVKDAAVTAVPGEWGAELAVGTGQVDWSAFFAALAEINFPGWLCFEREAGDQRVADIKAGVEFVRNLLGERS